MPISPVSVKIESDIKSRIKKIADRKQRTPHWLMREAIGQYVEREEKREQFRKDAVKAWKEFQATGRHVSHADADAWLSELEDGNNIEPPECRD